MRAEGCNFEIFEIFEISASSRVYRAIIKDPLFIIYVTLVFIVLGLYMYYLDSSPILERCIMKVLSYIFNCY